MLPLRFRKGGRMSCGGARAAHGATCYNEGTPSKPKKFLKSPHFLDPNGISNYTCEKF